MSIKVRSLFRLLRARALAGAAIALLACTGMAHAAVATAPQEHHGGGEANLVIPDLSSATFLGVDGHSLLLWGLAVCALGLLFGFVNYRRVTKLPVHPAMREISELIYETCKTYLNTQGKFLLLLEVFVGAAMIYYFGFLVTGADGQSFGAAKVGVILLFSLIGIGGSYAVAWFGIRLNTLANSRVAYASLLGRALPCMAIPLEAGMSIGMALISVELLIMLCILLFIPGDWAGAQHDLSESPA